MAAPYFNAHSLSSNAHKAYELAVSNSGPALHDCPQCSGVVFGMAVQQTTPGNYLNTSNSDGENFHNPFHDYRFPKVLVRVLYHQEPKQGEPLGSSNKTKPQHSDENIIYTGQSGLRVDQVWSMAVEVNSQPHSNSANPSPHDSILNDTVGNGASGMGQLTRQASSVVDNTSQKASRKAYEKFEKRKAAHKAYEKTEKRRAARKAYEKSEKRRAARKAYEQSEKRKASHRAYGQSNKGKASRKAYRESDKGRAYQRDYQRAYQKAFRKVFKNTGDRELAKIAGKQATALMKKSNKTKNSEIELTHG